LDRYLSYILNEKTNLVASLNHNAASEKYKNNFKVEWVEVGA